MRFAYDFPERVETASGAVLQRWSTLYQIRVGYLKSSLWITLIHYLFEATEFDRHSSNDFISVYRYVIISGAARPRRVMPWDGIVDVSWTTGF